MAQEITISMLANVCCSEGNSIARAYDLDAPADGTEKVFELPEQMLAQQVSSIIEWLTPQLLELADE